MNVGDLSPERFAARLATEGVAIRWGPFTSRIVSELPELAAPIHLLYADFPIESAGFADFHVLLRRHGVPFSRQVECVVGGIRIFEPFPRGMAFALLEWGLNWCVYALAHNFLLFHAAVVEHDGRALLLPGQSGVGKSTLCAALVTAGWRLLSDELALLDPADGRLRPLARPISLKNESVEIMKRLAPHATFGPTSDDTVKGRVAHMKPPASSVQRASDDAWPHLVVFPRFGREAPLRLTRLSKAESFVELAGTSLNYEMLGEQGFRTLTRLVDKSGCYRLGFSALDDAVAALNDLIVATGHVVHGEPAERWAPGEHGVRSVHAVGGQPLGGGPFQ